MLGSKRQEPDAMPIDKKCIQSAPEESLVWRLWPVNEDKDPVRGLLGLEELTSKEEIPDDQTNLSDPDSSTIMEIISNYPILKSFLAGSLSGTFSTVIFQPLDLVKTRLQNPQPVVMGSASSSPLVRSSMSMLSIMGRIVQNEQMLGLWKGMTPSLTRCIPGVGLYFMSVDILKKNMINGEPSPLQAIVIGMSARTLSGVCLIPVTVIKTRYESGVYNYSGVVDAFRIIYRTEGLRGLSCGLLPTLVRDAPFSGLYLMFYTQAKRITPHDWQKSSLAAPTNFCCGVFAGIMSSVVTQPADVLKTKMQLYPQKFVGLTSVIFYVYQKYGARGFFKGLVPRMLRRTLMAAMAWTVYEQRKGDMRTVPCSCYSGQSSRVSSVFCWESYKRPLTFLVVLLALAFTLSQLYSRFVESDSSSGPKGEMRQLHAKINQITQHLDNLALMQLELDKKISDIPNCCAIGGASEKVDSIISCPEDKTQVLIQETVQQAIATYDADDIGLADFALESAGGAVISTPETETYAVGIQPATLFGIPLCYPRNTPQEMIKAGSLPGECWAFKGSCGAAILRLLGYVNVTSISLEHIPVDISPAGDTKSAPKDFSLWGINCDKDDERFLLGNFKYDNTRKPVQNFPVQFQSSEPFHHVLVKFHSNYGHPNYTCVYRIRIHGTLMKPAFGLR